MKKLLICLLAVVMLVPLMTACDDGKNESSDTSAPEVGFVQTTPVKDMEGREFRVLYWDFSAGSNSILGYTGEILYAEENPSSVDEAKKWVVDQVEDQYNCTITGDSAYEYANSVPVQVKNQTLAGDPEILILDDASSALDYRTDANLRAAIKEHTHATTVIVAQRVCSVMHADHILVLEDGAVLAAGKHGELLSTCPAYREISESQMGGAFLE